MERLYWNQFHIVIQIRIFNGRRQKHCFILIHIYDLSQDYNIHFYDSKYVKYLNSISNCTCSNQNNIILLRHESAAHKHSLENFRRSTKCDFLRSGTFHAFSDRNTC